LDLSPAEENDPARYLGLRLQGIARPQGASNAEVLAACQDTKTNRARGLHLEQKLDFMKARMEDGVLRYFVGPAGSRPGLADAVPFVSRPEDYLDNSPKAEVTGK